MDLSLLGQSRMAVGRHRAALSGLGPWVGARVASPPCPILHLDPLSVPEGTRTEQIPLFRTWLAAWRWPSPVSISARPSRMEGGSGHVFRALCGIGWVVFRASAACR